MFQSERVRILSFLGYPSYKVSTTGKVWSRARNWASGEWRAIHPRTDSKGYKQVVLYGVDGKTKAWFVHRLVLEAFVGPCPDGLQGCHNDGDCRNNNVRNLRWDTCKNNMADRSRHGRTFRQHGVDNPAACLAAFQVRAIRKRWAEGASVVELIAEFRVSRGVISGVCHGKTYKSVI